MICIVMNPFATDFFVSFNRRCLIECWFRLYKRQYTQRECPRNSDENVCVRNSSTSVKCDSTAIVIGVVVAVQFHEILSCPLQCLAALYVLYSLFTLCYTLVRYIHSQTSLISKQHFSTYESLILHK